MSQSVMEKLIEIERLLEQAHEWNKRDDEKTEDALFDIGVLLGEVIATEHERKKSQ